MLVLVISALIACLYPRVSGGRSPNDYNSNRQHWKTVWTRTNLPGRGPTRLRARVRNRDRLENRSHVVPKTEFQDGGGRTRIFTHKITILA